MCVSLGQHDLIIDSAIKALSLLKDILQNSIYHKYHITGDDISLFCTFPCRQWITILCYILPLSDSAFNIPHLPSKFIHCNNTSDLKAQHMQCDQVCGFLYIYAHRERERERIRKRVLGYCKGMQDYKTSRGQHKTLALMLCSQVKSAYHALYIAVRHKCL